MQSRILTEIAEIVTGASPDRKRRGEPALFIQIKDLDPGKRALVSGPRPQSKRATPTRQGDVLIAARGGQAVTIADHVDLLGAYPTLDVYLIRPDAKALDPAYLTAWLTRESVASGLSASTTGALIPRIPVGSLRDLPIPLPSLQRQRAIGQLWRLGQQESALLDRLTTQTAHLRERQVAAAFASLESATA